MTNLHFLRIVSFLYSIAFTKNPAHGTQLVLSLSLWWSNCKHLGKFVCPEESTGYSHFQPVKWVKRFLEQQSSPEMNQRQAIIFRGFLLRSTFDLIHTASSPWCRTFIWNLSLMRFKLLLLSPFIAPIASIFCCTYVQFSILLLNLCMQSPFTFSSMDRVMQ